MKKTIEIEKTIDCNELTCGDCKEVLTNILATIGKCSEFQEDLKPTREGDFMRCNECLAAEIFVS